MNSINLFYSIEIINQDLTGKLKKIRVQEDYMSYMTHWIYKIWSKPVELHPYLVLFVLCIFMVFIEKNMYREMFKI